MANDRPHVGAILVSCREHCADRFEEVAMIRRPFESDELVLERICEEVVSAP
jgi:hypothetical protein